MERLTTLVDDGYFQERQRSAYLEYERCLALVSHLRRPDAVFCLSTALRALIIEPPRQLILSSSQLHICVRSRDRRSRTTEKVTFHYLTSPLSVVEIDYGQGPIYVTDPVSTCMQMAAYCTRIEETVLFDFLTRRGNSDKVRNEKELESYLTNSEPFRGKAVAKWAWEHHRMNTDSSMETRLRVFFAEHHLPMPEVNLLYTDPFDGRQWHVDLVYRELGIVFEYQGVQWHSNPETTMVNDADKSSSLQTAGCVIIPVTARKVLTEAGRSELLNSIKVLRQKRKRELSSRQKARCAALFR